jgi:RNA polymerase sigma-32 factor
MASTSLPALSEGGLRQYLQEIRKFPLLSEEEEYMLAKRYHEHGDISAAHRLVTSHLRLVAKIAMQYRGYGLPMNEMIAEGNIGLMQAVKKFEPDRGFRLATYAMWWIRAAMQEFILRSWSLVRIGTSATQKRLFFNLRKLKNRLMNHDNRDSAYLTDAEVKDIATELNVKPQDVRDMDRRLSGSDLFLNAKMGHDSDDEFIDQIADTAASQETVLLERDQAEDRHEKLGAAMAKLNAREQEIIRERRLKEEPATLEELSRKYNISRERVRQIEVRAMEKLTKDMTGAAGAAA